MELPKPFVVHGARRLPAVLARQIGGLEIHRHPFHQPQRVIGISRVHAAVEGDLVRRLVNHGGDVVRNRGNLPIDVGRIADRLGVGRRQVVQHHPISADRVVALGRGDVGPGVFGGESGEFLFAGEDQGDQGKLGFHEFHAALLPVIVKR